MSLLSWAINGSIIHHGNFESMTGRAKRYNSPRLACEGRGADVPTDELTKEIDHVPEKRLA
jgi:hypothetical protein